MSKIKRTLYIDADTVLYSSASQQQSIQCLAVNNVTTESVLYESKTLFNQWLANQTAYSKEDFTFQSVVSLIGKPEYAFQSIKQKIAKIFNASYCDDYVVCIQGAGNFRNDYPSEHVEYKGHRVAKPLLFQECFDYTVKKYGSRCHVSTGIETDDYVCIKGWESYNIGKATKSRSASPYVIAAVDKDIAANTRGWMMNYNKLEEGIYWNDGMSQSRKFFTQVLVGDNADNIPGIMRLGEATRKQYDIKTRGCGAASAEKILKDCVNETHMARNVVEAYKDAHPDIWKQLLTDNCFFLYLQRYEGEVFNVDEFFGRYSIVL